MPPGTEGDEVARRPRGQLRQDILDTVIELLIDTGDVDSVSIDAVVDRVGCTPPALYYYFPTKTELLRQACEVEFQKLAEHIEEGVAAVGGGTIARLERRGYALLHWAGEHPALYRILFMGGRRPAVVTGEGMGDDPSLRAMGENIETAIREGLIKPQDVDLLTLTLWGITHGYASLAVSFPVIPMAALEAAQGTAVRAMATEIFTADGLAAWRAAQASEGDETGPEGRAARS
ncbi:MAG TPA: TetR/AcrR family transcriptional regulator [Micropruina sp.]|nr:TetR/AcrR family transcriptional regulator [Micropruina sp.]